MGVAQKKVSNKEERVLSGIDELLGKDSSDDLRTVQRARLVEGRDILDLSMINPDLAPPRLLLDKLHEAVTKPRNHRYAVSRGLRRLRDGFAAKYRTRFGSTIDPETEVCACLGSKDGLHVALRVLTTPGDGVLLTSPTYPAHIAAVKLARLEPSFVALAADEEQLMADFETAFGAGTIRVAIVNFPNNPTGQTVSESFMSRLAALSERYDVWVINDFVYGEMVFGGTGVSLLRDRVGPRTIELYSLSKAYSVPGWRVGALLGPEQFIRQAARYKSHADYGIFLPLQYSAAAALSSNDDIPGAARHEYESRGQTLVEGLRRVGWNPVTPRAGACVWASHAQGANLPRMLLERHNIAVTPGSVFGSGYEGHVRFALVVPEDRIRELVRRLEGA